MVIPAQAGMTDFRNAFQPTFGCTVPGLFEASGLASPRSFGCAGVFLN
jgi:hypothetical protein